MLSTLNQDAALPPVPDVHVQAQQDDLEPLKQLLTREDRLLLELRSTEGVTLRTIASVLNCTRGTASRRLAALTKRLEHPRTTLIVNRGHELSPLYRHIAITKHIRGQSNLDIAERLAMHPNQVRLILNDVAAWCMLHLGG